MLKCSVFMALIASLLFLVIQVAKLHDFSAGGFPFIVSEQRITQETIPDLTGKTIIVTGANAGLGYSTVKHLATNGATVYMGCRSLKKCEKAKLAIAKKLFLGGPGAYPKFNKENLIPMRLDLGSFQSIKAFVNKFIRKTDKLHSLILNAGIMHTPYGLTTDGIEQQIGVNHFGHFYLTKLLLPTLENSEPATIVSVSSAGHHLSYPEGIRLSLEEMNDESKYHNFHAYGQSKLANVLFAQELASQMQLKGKQVYVNAVHPGTVDTELLRHYPDFIVNALKTFTKWFPNTLFFESDVAALVEVYAAVSPEIFEKELSGEYLVPIGEVVRKNDHARNKKLQRGLWELSETVLRDKGY